MPSGPFPHDEARRRRHMALAGVLVPAVERVVVRDGRIPAPDVAALVDEYDLAGPEDVMLHALPAAAARADAPISGYCVGAVGLELPGGDLLLGANLEFPGGDLRMTVHAEGAVAVRAFGRGTGVATLAVAQARPCAYCRQVLAEFAWAADLTIIDPGGHRLALADLYPWPFAPDDLGVRGAAPGAIAWPELAVDDPAIPPEVADLLVRTGSRAHAPYSRCPAAVVLRRRDGGLVAGSTIENVAFDPTIGPLQAAIVALRADGDGYAAIESAYLATRTGGAVDEARAALDLLAVVAPGVPLHVTAWS